MAVKRYDPTATLLESGKALVAGGEDLTGFPVPSAEVYDPAVNQWSPTGAMGKARAQPAAARLPGGDVLVMGGGDDAGPLAGAERYRPGSNTWAPAASMSTPRRYLTATLLMTGKVLVAGGLTSSGTATTATAELYDPVHDTWSPAASMTTARRSHAATLLADGRVLVMGGSNATTSHIASAELYDPVSGVWSSAGTMSTGRSSPLATRLASGKVLVSGGFDGPANDVAGAELYTPAALPPPIVVRHPPVNTVAPRVTGSAIVGQRLTCSPGTWTGTAPITYTYTWLRGTRLIASGSRYTAHTADSGRRLACRVTARNTAGSATATSATRKIASRFVKIKTKGDARPPRGVARRVGCGGTVRVRLLKGETVLARLTTHLGSRCSWSHTFRISRTKLGKATRLRLAWTFSGNAYLLPGRRERKVRVPRA